MNINRFKEPALILMLIGLVITLCLLVIGPVIDPTILEYPTSPETAQKFAPYAIIAGIFGLAGCIAAIIEFNSDKKASLGADDNE